MFALLFALALRPPPAPPAAADGPFRLVAREVVCRHEFAASEPVCEVGLELRWDAPRPVVRVAQTRLAGHAPNTFPGGKVAVAGDRHRTTVRLAGVKRTQIMVPLLESEFVVTAADRWLTFTLTDQPQTQDGISVTPHPPRRRDAVLEYRLDLVYPEGHPEFESFETWTANNRAQLVHPDGRTLEPDSFDENSTGRRVAVAYRFLVTIVGDGAGWRLVLDTPGPLREHTLRFTLKDIPLP